MIQLNIASSVNGGFLEGNIAYSEKWGSPINKKKLPKVGRLHVYDASSPVANFRIEEAFMAMLAMHKTGPLVEVVTDIGCGGTHEEYGSYWNIRPHKNQFWRNFYKETALVDRVDAKFAPISSGVFVATRKRKWEIIKMWLKIAPHLGLEKIFRILNFKVHVYETSFKNIKLNTLCNAVPEGSVILSFPCLVCSHQAQKTVYHSIRRSGSGMTITKDDRSSGISKCKGGFAWNIAWNKLTIWEAAYFLGAKLSGKATYYLATNKWIKPNIMVRDYSNPRGTVKMIVDSWGRNVWISPRIYLKNQGETSDNEIEDLKKSVRNNPKEWATMLNEFPILGDGRERTIKF
jgi:hypothetical protein